MSTINEPLGDRQNAQGGEETKSKDGFDAQSAIERARAIANSALSEKQQQQQQAVSATNNDGAERKRRRKNRWGDKTESATGAAVVNTTVVPTALTGNMSKEQLESYAAGLRIDEITGRLRSGDVVPPESQRSPSPPPTYNNEGKRTNTREHRYRKKLEEERMRLVEEQLKRNPNYKPPADFKRRSRFSEKVFIPVDDNPGLNFIGLLIGPRGNTLKKLEGDSGTKICIRGKGSIKEGKRRDDAQIIGADEELHCHIVADTEEKVKRGVKLVQQIIQKACMTPEGQNDLKRNQLRELAALNGTLRDDEGQPCLNCGMSGHRRWDCPEKDNITLSLTCQVCGSKGHIARDCNQRHDPAALERARERDQQLNSQYMNLMEELGESVPPSAESQASAGINEPTPGAASGSNADAVGTQMKQQQQQRHCASNQSSVPGSPSQMVLPPPSTPPWMRRKPHDRFYNRGPPHPHNNQYQYYQSRNSGYSRSRPPVPSHYDQSSSGYRQPPPPPPISHTTSASSVNGGYNYYNYQTQSLMTSVPPPPPEDEISPPPPPPEDEIPPPPPPPEEEEEWI